MIYVLLPLTITRSNDVISILIILIGTTANPPTNIVDFRGFDSSTIVT